jgi:hypothetical protein
MKEPFYLLLRRRVGSRSCSEKPEEPYTVSWAAPPFIKPIGIVYIQA